jgi:hypothetical protein
MTQNMKALLVELQALRLPERRRRVEQLPRGRFSSMTVEELRRKYIEVVQRETASSSRAYLVWKIREAEKGRIPVGPRRTHAREREPIEVKILPLRLEATTVGLMDEAWRTRGIKNRMDFLRRALGHYLTHLGAADAAAEFALAERFPKARRAPSISLTRSP